MRSPSPASSSRVYPHVCGAATLRSSIASRLYGLSPRVWGSPSSFPAAIARRRSIPTCVGQPARKSPSELSSKVYPHVCGAADSVSNDLATGTGLSPRVWGSHRTIAYLMPKSWSIPTCVGQPAQQSTYRSGKRSIPTCVGQPPTHINPKGTKEVYPHVCGAASRRELIAVPRLGLSPRVWGSRPTETRQC